MASLETIAYQGWPNCLRLSDGNLELIVTVDVGPRVIRLGFPDEANLFKEFPEQMGKTSGSEWMSFGGHRLWHAPEVFPRTYAPDFEPVDYSWENEVLTLRAPVEPSTGIGKEIEIGFDQGRIILRHRLINRNLWAVELSPWCLSVMAPGGQALIPQEAYYPHPEVVKPARPLVLWHFTKMNDPRFTWGERFIRLREDSRVAGKQKIGLRNSLGWAGYRLGRFLFLKTTPLFETAAYPDFGCNCEFYTEPGFLEVETLGPLAKIEPGAWVDHVEIWKVWKDVVLPEDDMILEEYLKPLVQELRKGRNHV